jgi:site-specific DNA recombinase
MALMAGIYARISYDPEGNRLGVDRQVPACEQLCADRGWSVVDRFVDDDASAFSGKRRPEYERLLNDVKSGRITAIVCWSSDRLTRRPIENEHIIDLAERLGTKLGTVTGEHDLATHDGRMAFRIMGAIARRESEHMSARRKLMLEQRARKGLPSFGGVRPFGFRPGGMELDEAEAGLIREAVGRLLRKGETVYAVLSDWRERGIHSPGTKKRPEGKPWSTTPFRDMITSARLAGLRQHRVCGKRAATGEHRHSDQCIEIIGEAAWPRIVSPAERDELRKMFARNPRRPGRSPVRLLVGVIFCGRCGRRLVSTWPSDNRGAWSYGCKKGISQDGCARTFIDGRQTDLLVTERVLDRLIHQGLANAVKATVQGSADDEALAQRIEEDDRALGELAHARFVERSIDHKRYLEVKAEIEQRQTEDHRLMGRHASAAALLDLPRTEAAMRHWWSSPSTTLEARRAVLRAVLARVEVQPRAIRRSQFEPGRVVVPEGGWRV